MNKIENKKQHVACVCIISTTYSHAAPVHLRPPVYIGEEAEEELICTFYPALFIFCHWQDCLWNYCNCVGWVLVVPAHTCSPVDFIWWHWDSELGLLGADALPYRCDFSSKHAVLVVRYYGIVRCCDVRACMKASGKSRLKYRRMTATIWCIHFSTLWKKVGSGNKVITD